MPSACPTWLLAIFTLFSTGARVQAQAETRPSLTQALPVESQCSYSGLFVPESDLSLNANGGLFFEGDTLFGLTKYKRQFVYNETCDYVKVTRPKAANRVQLQECSAPTYSTLPQQVTTSRHTRSSTCKSCCKTEMSISVPKTVTNLYTGIKYQAKHHNDSYQLINLGHCTKPDGPCGFGGICTQAQQIHWVLITTPRGDAFVPTTVPSHCSCVYI
ncbi:uncharacterized protein [Littorina saxatilis]|uniref:Spaetzle domain-containing protein n=1 Tax=Littorina saxatilis TaxID=31220 RepID=A0AAN9B4D2_9CAEN